MKTSGDITAREEEIGRILNDFLDRQSRGEAVSTSSLFVEYPEFAGELREHLDVLRGLAGSGSSAGLLRMPPPGEVPGYRIVREIHRGGQGVVYEAIQLSTRRTVAVKVLLEGRLADEHARWRFEQEVRLVASLEHRNIVVIYDSGIADGKYYFAMDYIRGQPIDTHVRLLQPLVRQLVKLFLSVCDAIAYAHRQGVIHRDLKPSNILVTENGTPVVLDFGLAKIIRDDLQESIAGIVSMPGRLMGTLPYMSPEQTVGDPHRIDIRTDVYTLGVILYELLTGTPPYETRTDLAIAVRNIRETDPARPSRLRKSVSSDLEAIVLKSLAKEPERRYQSAGHLAEDLKAWLDGRPISARSDSTFYVLRKLAAKHYFPTSVLTALVASIIGFGGITYQALRIERQRTSERDTSNAALQDVNEARVLAHARISASVHQLSLGWFLHEWQGGRLDRARAIRDQLSSDAPERQAMSFLLDGYSVEQFRAEMPASATPLIHFAIGERCMAVGEIQRAVEAFGLSVQSATRAGNQWWEATAEARRDQILAKASRAASAPAGVSR